MSNEKKWFRVTHWGRFTDVKVEEFEVTRATKLSVFYNETWAGETRETRATKETKDHTFVQGKKAAFDFAIDLTNRQIEATRNLHKNAVRNQEALQAQEND